MAKHLTHSLIIIAVCFVSYLIVPGQTTLKVGRRGHTSTALADARVLITGGENQTGAVREVEIIDLRSQTVKLTTPLKLARFRHTATLLKDGRVLVAGGWNGKEIFNTTEIFDPAANTFSPGPTLTRPRAAHNAFALADGRVFITGGCDDASAEVFDPKTETFTLLNGKMFAARRFHSTIVLQDNNVLLVGGVDQNGQRLDSAELFDTTTLSFSKTVGATKIRRVHPTLRLLPDGKVQIIGGDYDGTMELYDPDRKVFSAPTQLAHTLDIFPSDMLRAPTLAAFIDIPDTSQSNLAQTAKKKHRDKMLAHAEPGNRVLRSNSLLFDRRDYSVTENSDQAIVSGGIDSKGRFLRSVFLLNSSPASITTNKTEYLKGEQPIISGAGWKPGETVSIIRQEARPGHKRTLLKVVADDHGTFGNVKVPVTAEQQGVTYSLTVKGESSGNIAQTVYRYARHEKPKKLNFDVPVFPRDASFETAEGLLVVRPISRPAQPPLAADDTELFSQSFTYSFDLIKEKPCLGIAILLCNPSGNKFDLVVKEGSQISVGVRLLGSIDDDGASISVAQSVSGAMILEVTGRESIHLGPFEIPGAFESFSIGIEDVLGGSAGLGIGAEIDISLSGETKFVTSMSFNENAEVGFQINADGISPIHSADLGFSAGFTLINTEGGCLSVGIGPLATVSGSLIGNSVDGHAFLADYLKVCLNVTDADGCRKYEVPATIGVKGEVSATFDTLFTSPVTFATDFEEDVLSLGTIDSGIQSDTQAPIFTPKANVVETTDAGSCSTVVNFDLPTASDSCSGVKSVTCDIASGSVFQKGTTPVTCTATDNFNNTSQTTFNVVVQDQEKPVFTSAPADIVKFTDPGSCSAVTTFAVAASDNCPGMKLEGDFASGTAFPKGTTKVTYTATDESGNVSTHSFNVTVIDNEPASVTAVSANPSQLFPPTHGMVDVAINYVTTDNCPLPLNFAKLTVTSNEPVNGKGDGNTSTDWEVLDAHRVRLRSERSGNATGRIYTITITATDAAGNTTVKTVNVTVPHNQRR